MADKSLTEAAWKSFAKGKTYKDAALLKALAALDKAEKAGPADWLDALAEVDKQADALRKANKADKALGSQLDGIETAAARERKAAESARDKAAAEDDDEDSPALLTTKLLPLMRQVLKGDVVLQVLIATTGKDTALMLSRKSIAPARGKLLKEYLGVSGGTKLISGSCLLENKLPTFVVTTQAAGLAKKLKAALLAQTGQRFKVRVRGEDGAVDEDAEEDVDAAAEAAPATDAAAAYAARLAAIDPRLAQALQAQHPEATRLRAVSGFAREKAQASDFVGALKALEMLDKLLGAPAGAAATPGGSTGAATAPASASAGADAASADNRTAPGRFVNQAKARLAWQVTRQRIGADLQKLEQAILAHYREAPDLDELSSRVRRLDSVLQSLDASLVDTLDAALNAEPAQRAVLHEEAQVIVRRYADFVRNEPLLPALDDNPFVRLDTHRTLLKTLQILEGSLA